MIPQLLKLKTKDLPWILRGLSSVTGGIITLHSGFTVPGLLTIASGTGFLITNYQQEVKAQDAVYKLQKEIDEVKAELAVLQKEIDEVKAQLAVLEKERSENRGDLD